MKKQILFSFALLSIWLVPNAQLTTAGVYSFEDTVKYVDSKTSVYSGIPLGIDQLNGSMDDGYVQYAQKFEAPDTVIINGGCFYAVMDFDPSDTVYLMLYDTLASGGPGTVIDSVGLMALTLGSGYTGAMNNPTIELCGDFATPIKRKGSYYMGVQQQDTTDMFIARNADTDGAAEQLNWMYYKWGSNPSFDGWYNVFSFGTGWNFDFVLRPLVSYDIEMSLTLADNVLCLEDTVFTATAATNFDTVLLSNKFYNPNYAIYTGYSFLDSVNFNNGLGWTDDTSNTYNSGGMYNVTSTVYSTLGWTLNSVESSLTDVIEITDASVDLGGNQSGCVTDMITLDAGAGYDSYLWNDASSDTSLLIDLIGAANGDYTYFVDVTLNGCDYRDSVVINIADLNIDIGNDTVICLNQSIDLDAGMFDSYDWNTGQTTQNITIGSTTTPGDVIVTVEVMDGSCVGSDSLLVTFDDCLSINELETVLSVYPNPVQNELNIAIEGMKFDNLSFTIMDASGKIVRNETKFNSSQRINVSNLESGIYFVSVGSSNSKIVKQISVIK